MINSPWFQPDLEATSISHLRLGGSEATFADYAAVLPEGKPFAVLRPSDFIPGSVERPQSCHKDAQENKAADGSQDHPVELGDRTLGDSHLRILIVSREGPHLDSEALLDGQIGDKRQFGEPEGHRLAEDPRLYAPRPEVGRSRKSAGTSTNDRDMTIC
jgi:hypothetical protein